MEESPHSSRELRRRRANADDWITYASWTAIGTAAWTAFLTLSVWVGAEQRDPILLGSLMSGYVGQCAFGLKLRERKLWTAWALMAAFGITWVASVIEYGIMSGLFWKLLIGFVYVRGYVATDAYHELSKQIAAIEDHAAIDSSAALPAAAI
jgi:hypothetical protein